MNTRELCTALLRLLENFDGHPADESVLLEHFTLRHGRQVKGVFEDGLETLLGRGHVRAMDPEFKDEERRWVITVSGRAWLLENGV